MDIDAKRVEGDAKCVEGDEVMSDMVKRPRDEEGPGDEERFIDLGREIQVVRIGGLEVNQECDDEV